MPVLPNKIEVIVEPPPRGSTEANPEAFGFIASDVDCTFTWGLQPGQAILTWIKRGDQPAIVPLSTVTIKVGGHIFYGVCEQVTPVVSDDGNYLTQIFVDSRTFLQYDEVYCVINRRYDQMVNGRLVQGYKHLLPGDYNHHLWTFTTTAYTAAKILNMFFDAPTIETEWTRTYHTNLNVPVYEVDCYNGKKLGTAVLDVSQQCGTTFTLQGDRYNLIWTVKGIGTLPAFPTNSTRRRAGRTLSGNPTRLRVLGDRNLYHTLNCALEPDWKNSWQQFFTIDELWYYIFQNFTTDCDIGNIPAGTRYNAITADPDFVIGSQLASARARIITVGQFADAVDGLHEDAGEVFRDYRKFQGRSRLQMPAATYIATILFRCFRLPANFRLKSIYGDWIPLSGLDIVPNSLVEISHDPLTGVMSYDATVISSGNGYAIVKGYQVGADGYKTLRPDQVDFTKWQDLQQIWQHIEFQIDQSGEDGQSQFILFDEPIFYCADLLTFPVIGGVKQDFPVLKANPTFTIPQVRAALCLAGEKFSYVVGTASADGQPKAGSIRDDVENASGLNAQCVAFASGALPVELTFADGQTARQKAFQLAASLLNGQFYYDLGGYAVQGSNATQLTSMIDRVTVRLRPTKGEGLTEDVDFTAERQANVGWRGFQMQPPRDYERKQQLAPLFPGQDELRQEFKKITNAAAFLRANPKLKKYLIDAFYYYYGYDQHPVPWFVKDGAGAIAPGTPLFRETGNKRATAPNGAALTNPIFIGATVFDGENLDNNKPARVTAEGSSGVMLVRVKGPVEFGAAVGLNETKLPKDYLETSPGKVCGTAQDAIADGSIKIIRVQLNSASAAVSRHFPFQIYLSPANPAPVIPNQPDPNLNAWRTFRVRAGRVWPVDAPNTDEHDVNPDDNTIPPFDAGIEVVIPNGVEYWFWIDISEGAQVLHAANPVAHPDFPWTSFPTPDGKHIPIGMVNTGTNPAVVRQYLRTDVLTLCDMGIT